MNKGFKTEVGPKGHVVIVEQGDHSFVTTLTEVLRYQHSFLAGYFRNTEESSVDDKKQTSIKVEERKVEFFPFIEQYYARGKLRLEPSIDKKALLEELKYWFTNTRLNVEYKDPILELEFLRREAIKESIIVQANIIKQGVLAKAEAGFTSISFRFKAYQKPGYNEICCEVLQQMFPTDSPIISVSDKINISWRYFEGELGKMAGKVLSEKCKSLWKRLYTASKFNCITGNSSVDLGDESPYIVETKDDFIFYFGKYVKKKSPSMKNPPIININDNCVTLHWGIKTNNSTDNSNTKITTVTNNNNNNHHHHKRQRL